MTTEYLATCEGESMGVFRPIRTAGGRPAYQGVDAAGRLLGILWDDGRYGEAGRNGNTEWWLCEESPAHRRILAKASAPWETCPMEFTPIN